MAATNTPDARQDVIATPRLDAPVPLRKRASGGVPGGTGKLPGRPGATGPSVGRETLREVFRSANFRAMLRTASVRGDARGSAPLMQPRGEGSVQSAGVERETAAGVGRLASETPAYLRRAEEFGIHLEGSGKSARHISGGNRNPGTLYGWPRGAEGSKKAFEFRWCLHRSRTALKSAHPWGVSAIS